MNTTPCSQRVVRFGAGEFSYSVPWDGQPLTAGGYVAVDTETEALTASHEIPRLALASASAGGQANCLIHPDQLGEFVLAHAGAHFVFHNVAFDFWVVDRHLLECDQEAARRAWWEACDQNRMHDTMLLDMLIELARQDSDPRPRDLAAVGARYARLELRKDDPYRTRYAETIGMDWADLEEGFFSYAVKDAIATYHAYRRMDLEARGLMHEYSKHCPDIGDDAAQKFGPLSEAIQVKAAVALEQVSRSGMHLDLGAVRVAEADLRARLDAAVADLRRICPDLYKTRLDPATKQWVVSHNPKTQTPCRSDHALQRQLAQVLDDVFRDTGRRLPVPRTPTGRLSQSLKEWAEYATLHPFLEDWARVGELTKLCQFFGGLRESLVHPGYRCLLRTGRTSCSGPNIQQIPRDGQLRHAFVPSPGHFLLAVDYSFVELVTLAAVCRRRYGRSVLAEVISKQVDPHAYTAALILGKPLDDFMAWKDSSEAAEGPRTGGDEVAVTRGEQYKRWRQAAKAINFGTPGGLGAARLVDYARQTYKTGMTLEQARTFREKLTREIYPELDRYLAEDGMALLAGNLRTPVRELWDEFDRKGTRHPAVVGGLRNVVRGRAAKADGKPYSPAYVNRVWEGLARLCQDPEVRTLLQSRQGSEELCDRLFGTGVATLTGRIRGRVGYAQARNTPFQGLASDGAKLALWRLVREGFRVVGFVHDELLVELPDEGGFVSAAIVERVKEIMCRSMAEVLLTDIPVQCEATLSSCWSKRAKLIAARGKVYPWRPESTDGR